MAKVTLVISDISECEVDTKIYIEGADDACMYDSDSPAVYIATIALEAIREQLADGGEVITGGEYLGEEEETPVYTDNVLEFPLHKTLN